MQYLTKYEELKKQVTIELQSEVVKRYDNLTGNEIRLYYKITHLQNKLKYHYITLLKSTGPRKYRMLSKIFPPRNGPCGTSFL